MSELVGVRFVIVPPCSRTIAAMPAIHTAPPGLHQTSSRSVLVPATRPVVTLDHCVPSQCRSVAPYPETQTSDAERPHIDVSTFPCGRGLDQHQPALHRPGASG